MSERFDGVSKAMAGAHSRRSVLKILGGAAGAAVAATVLKPFRSDGAAIAACTGPTNVGPSPCAAGATPCGPCCCAAGIACLRSSTGQCGCPSGTTQCGTTCCKAGVACKDPRAGTCSGASAACLSGGNACANGCCPPGVPCVNGQCGCPSGTTNCGGVCVTCPTGGGCQGTTCGCPTGTTLTGTTCVKNASICDSSGDTCSGLDDFPCPGHSDCECVATTEGGRACVAANPGICTNMVCSSSNDCPAGSICVQNSSCCGGLHGANFCSATCSQF